MFWRLKFFWGWLVVFAMACNPTHDEAYGVYGQLGGEDYIDETKDLSRDLLIEATKSWLVDASKCGKLAKPISEIRVLHFPGRTGEETKRWLAAGILPSNLEGIEWNKNVAKEIHQNLRAASSPDITVHVGSAADFIASQENLNFDVISLDFTGFMSLVHIDTLRSIVAKSKQKRLLVHVNFYAARENAQSRSIYESAAQQFAYGIDSNYIAGALNVPELSPESKGWKKDTASSLWTARYAGLLKILNSSLSGVRYLNDDIAQWAYVQALEGLLLGPDGAQLKHDIVAALRKNPKPLVPYSDYSDDQFAQLTPSDWFALGTHPDFYPHDAIDALIQASLAYGLREYIGQYDSVIANNPQAAYVLSSLATAGVYTGTLYRLGRVQLYRYISKRGSPMLGAIVGLRKPAVWERQIELDAKNALLSRRSNGTIGMKPGTDLVRLINGLRSAYTRRPRDEYVYYNLGDGRPWLDEASLDEALEKGYTSAVIRRFFRISEQFEPTLNARIVERTTARESPILARELSADDVRGLLSEGIPIEEIRQAYPDEYSEEELKAMLAEVNAYR